MSAGTRMGARKRVLHFIESGGIYGAESVIINLSREMAAGGDYEPVIGCIVQRDDEAVDLVLTSLAPLGDEYVNALRDGLHQRAAHTSASSGNNQAHVRHGALPPR